MAGMSIITETDKEAAARLWQRNAPLLYKNLLKAVPVAVPADEGAGADEQGDG